MISPGFGEPQIMMPPTNGMTTMVSRVPIYIDLQVIKDFELHRQ